MTTAGKASLDCGRRPGPAAKPGLPAALVLFAFVLAAFVLAALHCGTDPAAEGFADRMQEMPWYERSADDYKEYSAEEVAKHIPEESERTGPELRLPDSGLVLPAGIQEAILILFLAVLVFFCAYLAYRWYNEREIESPRVLKTSLAGPEVLELPGLETSVSSELDLQAAIRAALAAGQDRKASAYIFAFFLLELSRRDLLELKKSRTAREYVREVVRDDRHSEHLRFVFKRAAALFEVAVYAAAAPGEDIGSLWSEVRSVLGLAGEAARR